LASGMEIGDADFRWARERAQELIRARVELATEDLAAHLLLANVQESLNQATTPQQLVALILVFTQLTYGLADFLARQEGRTDGIDARRMDELLDILFSDESYW
jgi:hypothetical protein